MKSKVTIINKCRDYDNVVIAPKKDYYAIYNKLTPEDMKALKVLSVSESAISSYRIYKKIWINAYEKYKISTKEIIQVADRIENASSLQEIKAIASIVAKNYLSKCYEEPRQQMPISLQKKSTKERADTIAIENAVNLSTHIGLAAFVKVTLFTKYEKIFAELSEKKLDNIYNLLITTKDEDLDETIATIRDYVDNLDSSNRPNNNIFSKLSDNLMLEALKETYEKKLAHLCWHGCKNAHADTCEKIADRRKKIITEYPFITKGQQEIENGEVVKFIVNRCDKYRYERDNVEDSKGRTEKKQTLRMLYFETETVVEAYSKQNSLRRRGLLIKTRRSK